MSRVVVRRTRVVVRLVVVRLVGDVRGSIRRRRLRSTWERSVMWSRPVLAVQVREGSSLVARHLLELQQNLLLRELRAIYLSHLLEGIGFEVEIERLPRLERGPIRERDHIRHESLSERILELRHPPHGCHLDLFLSLDFLYPESCKLLPEGGLPLREEVVSHHPRLSLQVAVHPMQLVGDVRLHLAKSGDSSVAYAPS